MHGETQDGGLVAGLKEWLCVEQRNANKVPKEGYGAGKSDGWPERRIDNGAKRR